MSAQPLAQSRADQLRFVDRTREADAIIRAVAASQPVLLLGERGSGRTSLLNHVAWRLAHQSEPRDTVMVSGESASNPSQLLGVLVARVGRLAEPTGSRARWIEDLRALSLPDGPFGQVAQPAILMELVDLLSERLAELDRPVCVLVDGIAPRVAHGVFGSLRNELWTLESTSWVVTGDGAAEALYLEPPADAFFEHTVNLGPLADADAAMLLSAHETKLTDAEINRAIALAKGNPRRLLRAANDIQAGIAPVNSPGDERGQRASAVAGPLAGALVEYIAEHGPAGASDETLLRQIGASRQRASQLMHELEAAGLLETIEQHEPGRRGRPPRRFALRSSAGTTPA
jgi:energy-coupling factor transporter ATP-binding protein EcfA2